MDTRQISPLADIPIAPALRAIPKADIHVHQEAQMHIDRVLARRDGRPAYNWRAWVGRLLDETPPGLPRLEAMTVALPLDRAAEANQAIFVARLVDLLEAEAAGGAVLVEVIAGPDAVMRPDFMGLFREAEGRVHARFPSLRAEAIGYLQLVEDPELLSNTERVFTTYLQVAREGLAGVNFSTNPYDREASPILWKTAYRWAERASQAGLGITVHAGEFSTANLEAALRMPNLTRIGHATYAPSDPRLLDLVAERGVTVECSLSCNVILGAVAAYEAHGLRHFVERGIPVTLSTDNPVRIQTTIEREYALAIALGCSETDIAHFTRAAIMASFTSPERRAGILAELDAWESDHSPSNRI